MLVRQASLRFGDKIVVNARKKRLGVFPHGRRIVDDVQRDKIEEGIGKE